MADIELVIRIPEGLKKDFELEQWTALSCMEMKDALMKGTPLPKGHGRLKDVDKIISDGISKGFCDWYDEIKYAETIIEADDKNKAKSATSYDSNEEDREF